MSIGLTIGICLASTLSEGRPDASTPAPSSFKDRYLTAGLRLFQGLDFEGALEQLNRARGASDLTPDEDITLNLYCGLAQAELGKNEEAKSSFRLAMSLSPGV